MEDFTNYHKLIEENVMSADQSELERLAKSKELLIRKTVASKGNLSDDLFRELVADEDAVVRCAVTVNREVTPQVLMLLIHDQEWEVRWSVAGSQNVTKEILLLLLDDKEEEVRLEAKAHLDYFEKQKNGQ